MHINNIEYSLLSPFQTIVKDAIDIALKDIFPIDETKQPYDMPVMEDFEKATKLSQQT